MSSLEYKKELINNLTKNIENFLFQYTKNNALSGYIVTMIHWLVMFVVYLYILLGDVNIIFYMCCIFLLLTYILHLYFSGCVLIRIERQLWNTDKWWGIWTIFFLFIQKLGIPITKTVTEYTYTLWSIFLSILILLKISLHKLLHKLIKNKKF
jgi:hypothetical protein